MRASPVLLAAIATALLASPALADPTGLWLTQKQDAKIRVAPCGGALCGTIIWLAEPIDRKTGKPQTDVNNVDPSKRGRPIIGVAILTGMTPNGANRWSGRIYNASDDGKVYNGHMTLTGPSTLKVEGCVAFICQSENWTRTN
jgi:uncharacterized protein (DUF2147 family)